MAPVAEDSCSTETDLWQERNVAESWSSPTADSRRLRHPAHLLLKLLIMVFGLAAGSSITFTLSGIPATWHRRPLVRRAFQIRRPSGLTISHPGTTVRLALARGGVDTANMQFAVIAEPRKLPQGAWRRREAHLAGMLAAAQSQHSSALLTSNSLLKAVPKAPKVQARKVLERIGPMISLAVQLPSLPSATKKKVPEPTKVDSVRLLQEVVLTVQKCSRILNQLATAQKASHATNRMRAKELLEQVALTCGISESAAMKMAWTRLLREKQSTVVERFRETALEREPSLERHRLKQENRVLSSLLSKDPRGACHGVPADDLLLSLLAEGDIRLRPARAGSGFGIQQPKNLGAQLSQSCRESLHVVARRKSRLEAAQPVWDRTTAWREYGICHHEAESLPASGSAGGHSTHDSQWGGPSCQGDSVDISVLVQYFQQPKFLKEMTRSYVRCFRKPGNSSAEDETYANAELLVNVDQPGEAVSWVQTWRSFVAKAPDGDSMPVLFVIFNHNVHENRAYNNLASAARGDVVVLVQDDDLAPRNCSWLTRTMKMFTSHYRVGAVGLMGGAKVWGYLPSISSEEDRFNTDKATGQLADFAQVVDVGPLAVMRHAWLDLGGFDESWGPLGQTGVISDWQFLQRLWLSGYAAMHLSANEKAGLYRKHVQSGWTHRKATLSSSFRLLNEGMNLELFRRRLVPETQANVEPEVLRMMQLSFPADPSHTCKLEYPHTE